MSSYKYFKVEVKLTLYDPSIGRKSFISDGYRPRIYLGYSDPSTNISYSSDCIVQIGNKETMYPGQTRSVIMLILNFEHLTGLLYKNVHVKIKEGLKFVGEGIITEVFGEE